VGVKAASQQIQERSAPDFIKGSRCDKEVRVDRGPTGDFTITTRVWRGPDRGPREGRVRKRAGNNESLLGKVPRRSRHGGKLQGKEQKGGVYAIRVPVLSFEGKIVWEPRKEEVTGG